MSLFVCDKCHCVENTSSGRYWTKTCDSLWAKENLGQALCIVCAPKTFKSGAPNPRAGKWHDYFPREKVAPEEIQDWIDHGNEGKFIYVPKELVK